MALRDYRLRRSSGPGITIPAPVSRTGQFTVATGSAVCSSLLPGRLILWPHGGNPFCLVRMDIAAVAYRLIVEGARGDAATSEVVFRAFGVISYADAT